MKNVAGPITLYNNCIKVYKFEIINQIQNPFILRSGNYIKLLIKKTTNKTIKNR